MVSDFGSRDSSNCCRNMRNDSERRLSYVEVRFIRSIRERQARVSDRIRDLSNRVILERYHAFLREL